MEKEPMEIEFAEKILKSTCGICQTGCGIRIHVRNSKIVAVDGDPDSPVNRGHLCVKGRAWSEHLNSPLRLTRPLLRSREKGSGVWKAVRWDEALDRVAEGFKKAKLSHGPESLVFIRGSYKGGYQGTHLARLANAFGVSNIASMASVCYVPRANASLLTQGYNPVPDYDNPQRCIVIWGANYAATRIGEYQATLDARRRGSKLIVIDPRKIPLAEKAEVFLQPRPGSDLALALGLINVIINEGLYDRVFVERWTLGFEKLKHHVQDYSPRTVSAITWVKAESIEEAARLYAGCKPGIIQLGNAIDHTVNNFQTARAVSILKALTGNLAVPGGEVPCLWPPVHHPMGSPAMDLRDSLPEEARRKRLNALDRFLPMIFYALPQAIVRAVLEQEPYPVRAAFIQGANVLATYTNARRTYQALRSLDFLVVADFFMTPTAALADVVLPAASYLEYDSLVAPPYYPVVQIQQKAAQIGECRSDYDIVKGLADRLGIGRHFWDTEVEAMDFALKPTGLTFDEFRGIGVLSGKKEIGKHEREGFATPSGKVELFSQRLQEWGFNPLPSYHEPPETPFSDPELAREFPLVLTSWKAELYRHSGGRNLPPLRDASPEPLVWLHPDTATACGVVDGNMAWIETRRGRIRQRVRTTEDIMPGVAGVDYGWWFPEKSARDLYGWADANANILTDDSPPYGAEMGTPCLRGFLCKITRA